MADLDKAAERIEQGEAWDETDEVVTVEVKKPLDKVIKQERAAKDYVRGYQEVPESAKEVEAAHQMGNTALAEEPWDIGLRACGPWHINSPPVRPGILSWKLV